jgi:hypothetical protein
MAETPEKPGQIELFGVSVGSPADEFENELADASPIKRKPMPIGGRPKGARNRRSEDFDRLYRAHGLPDPQLALGQFVAMGIDGIVERLGIHTDDAAKLWLRACEILMPYRHSKKPAQLHIEGSDARPVLVIGDVDTPAALRQAQTDGLCSIDDGLLEVLEEQGLISSAAAASHGGQSHETAKSEAEQHDKAPKDAD